MKNAARVCDVKTAIAKLNQFSAELRSWTALWPYEVIFHGKCAKIMKLSSEALELLSFQFINRGIACRGNAVSTEQAAFLALCIHGPYPHGFEKEDERLRHALIRPAHILEFENHIAEQIVRDVAERRVVETNRQALFTLMSNKIQLPQVSLTLGKKTSCFNSLCHNMRTVVEVIERPNDIRQRLCNAVFKEFVMKHNLLLFTSVISN